jgi:hypothetical protein
VLPERNQDKPLPEKPRTVLSKNKFLAKQVSGNSSLYPMLFLFKGQSQQPDKSLRQKLIPAIAIIGIGISCAIAPQVKATERPLSLKEQIELGLFPPTYSSENVGIPLDLALPQPDAIIPLGQHINGHEYAPGNLDGESLENPMAEEFLPVTPAIEREVPTEE